MVEKNAFSKFRTSTEKSAGEVASLFNVNRATIFRWENGEVPIPVKRLEEVERVTGISRHDLRPDIFGTSKQAASV